MKLRPPHLVTQADILRRAAAIQKEKAHRDRQTARLNLMGDTLHTIAIGSLKISQTAQAYRDLRQLAGFTLGALHRQSPAL